MDDEVMQAVREGRTSIELNPAKRNVAHTILGFPFRHYFIRVKEELMLGIINSSKKYPKSTKYNTDDMVTHAILDAGESILSRAKVRKNLIEAAIRIGAGETAHDRFYRGLFQVFLEEMVKKLLDGKLDTRELGEPSKEFWYEEMPYGGEHSILYQIMDRREEIKELLRRPKDE
jgi:hypothetical protein